MFIPACCALIAAEGAPASNDAPTNQLPLITTARQLLELPLTEHPRHYPVQLRGVVTYFDPAFKNLYVHDDTAGFWVYRDYRETNLQTGQLVEILGVTDRISAPGLRPKSIRILGSAPLPAPRWTSFERLASGHDDCEWLQVQGVVHTMAFRLGLLKLDLAVGSDHVPLYLPGFDNQPLPTNLIGASIEARGVCGMKYNAAQITGFFFHVPSMDFITVLRPGPSNPFALTNSSVQSLRAYKRLQPGERIKVTGVVTLWWPSGRFFIQDETGPLEIQLLAPWVRDDPKGRYLDPLPAVPVAPGDLVEVVGYGSTELSPVLVDAEYRRIGRGAEIKPVRLDAQKSAMEIPNAKLVSVDANVLDAEIRSADTNLEPQLVLQAGGSVFEALLPRATGAKLDIARGSVVCVTGINSVQTDPGGDVATFSSCCATRGTSPSSWCRRAGRCTRPRGSVPLPVA